MWPDLMISVCIPVFNHDVSGLVEALHRQFSQLGIPEEIILIDDASGEKIREINRRIPDEIATLIELDRNTGRSRIRNRFAEQAKHPYLLFLDCDCEIPTERFLYEYLEAIRMHPGRVICGGVMYDPVKPGRSRILHWKYGTKKESRSAGIRNSDPNRSFMSASFVIPRTLFEKIRFDERLTAYGHEDSLFGYRLSELGHTIFHMDNPVIHRGLENNRAFLDKTDEGLRNLVAITGYVDSHPRFTESITLLHYAGRLQEKKMAWMVRIPYFVFGSLLRKLLCTGFAGLHLYAFYKMGRYLEIREKKQKSSGSG